MDVHERKIIDMINNSSNPAKALDIAIKLALNLLESLGASQCTEPSSQEASA